MNKTYKDMLYLVSCVANKIIPEKEKVESIDLDKLFELSQFHSLTAIVAFALKSVGIQDKKFIYLYFKSKSKSIRLDAEREKIFDFMENNKIWHVSLKGIVLKDLYPEIGLRQMVDNDVFYDKDYQYQLCEYMENNGYSAESIGISHHDVYMKLPIYNFEMHTELFSKSCDTRIYNYYKNIKKKLIKDSSYEYLYKLTDEDFYIYMIAHEYKHYIGSGTGIRSLLDQYLYIKSKANNLDFDYISEELEKLGILEFECTSRNLAIKLFDNMKFDELTESECKILRIYLTSGTHGTFEVYVKNAIKKSNSSKIKYILGRIFPPACNYEGLYPNLCKYKVFVPFFYMYRVIKAVIFKRKAIISELSAVKRYKSIE